MSEIKVGRTSITVKVKAFARSGRSCADHAEYLANGDKNIDWMKFEDLPRA